MLGFLVSGRQALTQCKNGKPAVALMSDYALWLLNTTDSVMHVKAGELCGFGTGAFEEAIFRNLFAF